MNATIRRRPWNFNIQEFLNVYINDEKMDDKYAYGMTSDYDRITLKSDEYFILGDNRLISKDSRYFGPIKEKEIKGKVVFRIFPFSKFGKI